MSSRRDLERRIKKLEIVLRPKARHFSYQSREDGIDAKRSEIIKRRCQDEFKFNSRNGDIMIEFVQFADENGEFETNFRYDYVLKIDDVEYNDGWPFEH